jgi:hypothetical protein
MQRSSEAMISSVSKCACGDRRKNSSQNARTAAAPLMRVPSGAGRVFSKTQSSVIQLMMASTSWRLNASLKRSITVRVASGMWAV